MTLIVPHCYWMKTFTINMLKRNGGGSFMLSWQAHSIVGTEKLCHFLLHFVLPSSILDHMQAQLCCNQNNWSSSLMQPEHGQKLMISSVQLSFTNPHLFSSWENNIIYLSALNDMESNSKQVYSGSNISVTFLWPGSNHRVTPQVSPGIFIMAP